MKILLCHDFYQQPGGEDQVFADEAALLESHGHEVLRFTVHNNAINGMSRLSVGGKTIWNRPMHRQISELVAAHRPHVAHFHNTFPLISPAAYYAARRHGAAVVQTLHNYRLICPDTFMLREGRICRECQGRVMPWPAIQHGCYHRSRAGSLVVATMLATHRLAGTYRRQVDRYIAVAQFGRQVLIEGGLPSDKIIVKPYFVEPDPGIGPGRGGYAVFVGRLSPEKGIDTLLAAWERLGDIPLKILGDGPLAGTVAEAAGRLPNVQWLGRQPQPEVSRLVGDAAMLVFPSVWYEGLPKTILESFAKGTPVVASRMGAMIEMIDPGRTGAHFEPGDPVDLAGKVRSLWADPEQLARLRLEARREYETRYTAKRNYPMLMGVYRDAVAHLAAERQAEPALQS